MSLTLENKKKLLLSSLMIGLATSSQIAGQTLANTIILIAFPTTMLPYFYLAQAVLLIFVSMLFVQVQRKYPQNFGFIVKVTILILLFLFAVLLHDGGTIILFVIPVVIIICSAMTVLMGWLYLSDIFDIQEFKQFSKILQSAAVLGTLTSGIFVSRIASPFHPNNFLALMFVLEFASLFFIFPLSKYLVASKLPGTISSKIVKKVKKNQLFKYFALFALASTLITILIDYNMKLELIAHIKKEEIASVINMIFVVSTSLILLIQIFLFDFLLRALGSKKMIIIYPIVLLFAALITLMYFSFSSMVFLFISNAVFYATTFSLSRNLYMNVLPAALKNSLRIKLNGQVAPLGVICTSLIILLLSYSKHVETFSLILIIFASLGSICLSKRLIEYYRKQLGESLYLRRFNHDLIQMAQIDKKDVAYLLEKALKYPAVEAVMFGLQLLANERTRQLPLSLQALLNRDEPEIVSEVAKILSGRPDQKQFIQSAHVTVLKSQDDKVRWYLCLYLLNASDVNLLDQISTLQEYNTPGSLALLSLIALKQGDLEQQLMAIQTALKLYSSVDAEEKKWFLYLLRELPLLQKDQYLILYFHQKNIVLQRMAMQQVGKNPSPELFETLIALLGEPTLWHALNDCLMRIGPSVIPKIEEKLDSTNHYSIKIACVRILSLLEGEQAERGLMTALSSSSNVVMNTTMAKLIAFRGVKSKISEVFSQFLTVKIKDEVALFIQLSSLLKQYDNQAICNEIKSRLQFVKIRVLYYTAAVMGAVDVLNSLSLLTAYKTDKKQQAIALELIDATDENREISDFLKVLFIDSEEQPQNTAGQPIDDPWLNQFIHDIESNQMDAIYTLTKLRQLNLFKELPAETLQVLVGCCSARDMSCNEVIFSEGDSGDGLYIVDSGAVAVTKKGIQIATLTEGMYFGELALLADISRFGTVTAIADGVLFYIDKQDFDRITDEIPAIVKSINKQVIAYLYKNAKD